MKLLTYTALAVFLSISSVVSAQLVAELSISHAAFNPVENTMCVPIIANRYQEVFAHQIELRFDPSQIRFESVRTVHDGLRVNHSQFGNFMPGQLRYIYFPSDSILTTLPDTSVLFEVCFNPRLPQGYSDVVFDSVYAPIFTDENGQFVAAASLLDGSITFGEGPTIPLRPGDTNVDGIVDHTDLLNIGLAYGATGPARDMVKEAFSVVEALPWAQNLPDGTNFANTDADGNGTIEAADVEILNTFYGQEAPGLWNPAGGTFTGRSAAPPLYLGGSDTINAGELVTLPIYLGEAGNTAPGGNGLAFTLEFPTDEVEASSLAIDLDDSFLGEDLLSIATVTEVETGRFEVALVRKDRTDAPAPAGPALVGNLRFRAINNSASGDYRLNLVLTPDAYFNSQQANIVLGVTGKEIEVKATVSSQNPTLVRGINIYPNPTQEGLVMLSKLPAGVTEISLYTMQGQELERYPGSQRTLDLSRLAGGVYVVRIVAGSEQINRLVVKGL